MINLQSLRQSRGSTLLQANEALQNDINKMENDIKALKKNVEETAKSIEKVEREKMDLEKYITELQNNYVSLKEYDIYTTELEQLLEHKYLTLEKLESCIEQQTPRNDKTEEDVLKLNELYNKLSDDFFSLEEKIMNNIEKRIEVVSKKEKDKVNKINLSKLK